MSNKFEVLDCPAFLCNQGLFRVPVERLAATKAWRLDTRNLLGKSGDVLGNSAALMESTSFTPIGLLHGRYFATPVSGSVFRNAGKCVSEERRDDLVKDTFPTRRFLGKSSTWNFPSHAEGVHAQNFVVDHQRPQISEMYSDVLEVVLVPDHLWRQCCGSKTWK